jgi:hypothetical protein
MTLDELNAVDTKDAAAVKTLQEFLKSRGYYKGKIDGTWGGGTTDGADKLRNDLMETAKIARDKAVAEQGTAQTTAESNSPLNNALRGATEFGPYAGGAALGAWMGHKGKQGLDARWARDAAETKAMANDPSIAGPVAERKMGSMRSSRNAITGAQFLAPAALLGSAEFIRGHVAPNFEGETKKWINLGANADQGAGLGLAAHQLFDLKNRIGSPADAADEARIETRANPPAPPPPPPPPNTRPNSERLIAAAKAAGATGAQAKTKTAAAEFLANNVTEANRAAVLAELPAGTTVRQITSTVKRLASKPGASSIVAPLLGGAVAYDAASSDAEAAGATPGEARAAGAKAGAGGAALTAGGAYGLSKILEKAPTLGNALGMGGGFGSGLSIASNMGPNTDLEHQKERTAIAQKYPRLASLMGIQDEMAQVPERNMGKTDEFAQARALQVPQGIPMPQPNGQLPPELLAAMGAGPQMPQQQPPMPMRRPQMPYAALGFGGRY